jgi:tetratricopeptide (TPR) repeat protein
LSRALDLLGELADVEGAQIQLQTGQLHWRSGDYAAAKESLTAAVAIAERQGQDEVLAEAFKQLGNIPLHTGDPHEAIDLFERSRTIYERLEDLAGIAMARLNLGTTYGRMGRWDECLVELQASLSHFERIGDLWHQAVVRNNLGELHRLLNDLPRAVRSYEEALAISAQVGDAAGVALAYTGAGIARVEAGDIVRGKADLLEAESRFSALGRSMYMPHIYRYLATAELVGGNVEAAQQAAQRSAEFARAASARNEEAITQRVLGEIALARGAMDEARHLLEVSQRTLTDLGDAAELERTESVMRRLTT